MKRKLSIILCCLLMLSMIMPFQHKMVLASENKANEFKSEVEGSTSNFVKLFIEDKNHELTSSEFDIQVKNSRSYFFIVPKIERIEDGWLVNLNDLSWQEGEKKYISVVTSKYLLTKEITKVDEGSTIELKPSENLVPLQVNVSFAGDNFIIDKVSVYYVIEQDGVKRSNYGGTVKIGTLIPQGNCSINLIAYDENNAYNLVKNNWEMTKDNNSVSFDRDETAKVKINTDSLQSVNGELVYIVPRNVGYIGSLYASDCKKGDKTYDSFFVNKEACKSIGYTIEVSDWDYSFQTKNLQLKDDSTVINVGTNLKANINLNKQAYIGGEELGTDELKIVDEYDNEFRFAYGITGFNLDLVWEIKSENGETTRVLIKDRTRLTLPNVSGTFDISIKNTNGPLNISCDPVKITITSETLESPVKFADANLEKVIRESIEKPEGQIYKSDLTEIYYLIGDERNISSLEGIENLTNLGFLYLSKNNIEDITPLSSLYLAELNLYRNKVKNIDALKNMNNLQGLVLDVNQIEDISVLKNKTKLKELSVCANPVKDLEALRTLPNLTSFHFGENQNVDISILECLPNLTDLRWAYTRSTENIDVLKNLTKLEKAILCGNKIKDITPLAKLTNLSELYIDQNEISDITALVDNCANGGFSKGSKSINISNNNLDITQGSNAHNNIVTLIAKGINITFEPQNAIIPQPINKMEVELLTKVVDFKAGEAAKLEYKVTNNMSEEKEVTLIIGVYDISNRLLGYVKTSKIVKAGEIVNLDSSIIELSAGAYKVKAFVWDNLENMNPYINSLEIPVN